MNLIDNHHLNVLTNFSRCSGNSKPLSLQELFTVFHHCFALNYNVQLINGLAVGHNEPVYIPAQSHQPAQIIFAHGFIRSALHEIAHWCYAGYKRRQLEDYGYWYHGEFRDQAQQSAFEAAELMPQAYELILSAAAGIKFEVSCDNFNSQVIINRHQFTQQVVAQAQRRLISGVSPRLALLRQAIGEWRNLTPAAQFEMELNDQNLPCLHVENI